jgi:hypothetical protein
MDDGERLALIVSAWTALVREGDAGELERLLDERVTWQGVLPELVCRDRDEVLGLLARARARGWRITRLEAQEAGDVVAISVEGPDFTATDTEAALAPRSLVFTFRGRKVVRMESFTSRHLAFAALTASSSHRQKGV